MPQTFNVGSRSLFVSVTAWVFIVFGIAASALSVIQGAATAALLPGFNLTLDVRPLHGLVQVLAAHLPWVAGAALALSIGTLVAAIGLLLAPGVGAPRVHRRGGAGHRRQPGRAVAAAGAAAGADRSHVEPRAVAASRRRACSAASPPPRAPRP